MAEERTRRVLKLFGIAVTDLEEAVRRLNDSLEGATDPVALIGALELYLRAFSGLTQHLAEVSQLIAETCQSGHDHLRMALSKLRS
ncbi:MAG TPA: hypothetical protein VJO34_13640 [Methylomirabilota bacterium]|nr:hypothetical protein [Methylomirabilota bacterium]